MMNKRQWKKRNRTYPFKPDWMGLDWATGPDQTLYYTREGDTITMRKVAGNVTQEDVDFVKKMLKLTTPPNRKWHSLDKEQ